MFIGMGISWAWRSWVLNINQHSEATLPSRALSHKTFLKLLGHVLAFHLPQCPKNPEIYRLMVIAAKAVFDLHIPNEYILVSDYKEKETPSPCVTKKRLPWMYFWVTCVLLYRASIRHWGVCGPPWVPGIADMMLFLYAYRESHLSVLLGHVLQQAHTIMPPLPVFS